MGKIEMDLSEYDKMMENKRLLEASLEKERALGARIKELEEEKRKALEDSAHKVTKIIKTVVEEHTMAVVDSSGIVSSGMDPESQFMDVLKTAADILRNRSSASPISAAHDFLRRHLFRTVVSETVKDEYVDTSQSIKDLKREIANKEYDKARERVETEMNERDRLKERVSHLVGEKRRLEKELKEEKMSNDGVKLVISDMDDLRTKNDELIRENEALNVKNQRADNHFIELYNLVNKEYGLFGKSQKIADLTKTIMSFKR